MVDKNKRHPPGSDKQDSLLEFPCDFPIKVMGINSAEVRAAIEKAVKEYHARLSASESFSSIGEQPSRTGKYMSFTVTLRFHSKQQIDQMYQYFIDIDGVSMVL